MPEATDPSQLAIPSQPEWAALLRPGAQGVRLVELESCSHLDPECQDEYACAAEVASLPCELEADATRAFGRIVKGLLCLDGDWPAEEPWDDEALEHQALHCVRLFGTGTHAPADIASVLFRAGDVQRAIAETRARAGQPPLPSTWPTAPLQLVYAVKDEWNHMFYFGRTDDEWTCFWWSTGV